MNLDSTFKLRFLIDQTENSKKSKSVQVCLKQSKCHFFLCLLFMTKNKKIATVKFGDIVSSHQNQHITTIMSLFEEQSIQVELFKKKMYRTVYR